MREEEEVREGGIKWGIRWGIRGGIKGGLLAVDSKIFLKFIIIIFNAGTTKPKIMVDISTNTENDVPIDGGLQEKPLNLQVHGINCFILIS